MHKLLMSKGRKEAVHVWHSDSNIDHNNVNTGKLSLSTTILYKAKATAAAMSDNSPPERARDVAAALTVACAGPDEEEVDGVPAGILLGPPGVNGSKIVPLPGIVELLPPGTLMWPSSLWHVGAKLRGPLKVLMAVGRTLVQSVNFWIFLTPRRDRRR
jgi:hypothetical protein